MFNLLVLLVEDFAEKVYQGHLSADPPHLGALPILLVGAQCLDRHGRVDDGKRA